MEIYPYKIRTTQVTIQTAAQNEQAAKEMVMESELCPESAILSVTRLDIPNHF